MNRICIFCTKEEFAPFVAKIKDSLNMLKYMAEDLSETSVRIKNKYFFANIEFFQSENPDMQIPADAYVLLKQPTRYPTETQREKIVFVAAVVEKEEESGRWDQDDFMFDYFIDADEVGEIIGQSPFNKIERIDKQQKQPEQALDISTLIESIVDCNIKAQVQKMLQLFQQMSFESESVEAFDSVFTHLESMRAVLQSASQQDRANAAAAIAIMLGNEVGVANEANAQ